MYGALDGFAADIGGNRGAMVQLFTNFQKQDNGAIKSTVLHCN
jgi:hypothetical protein